ncbi:MAG: N-acetylmuramoyl-L-alanine amidase [Chloroflexota bacterium]
MVYFSKYLVLGVISRSLIGILVLGATTIPGASATTAQTFDADVGLDPGHSYVDVGAAGGGLREFELALDIGQRVRERLEERGLSVRMTRTNAQPLSAMNHPDSTERVRIEQEARLASVGRVRAYVSIHFNGHPSPSLRGTETYFNVDGLAGAENQRLADVLQRNVVNALWEGGYPAVDRGVKSDLAAGKPYGHFFSLRGPAPSVLVEGLFLSSPGEAAALGTPEVRDALSWGYVRGILEFFSVSAATEPANRSFQQTPMASSTMPLDILD